MTYKDYVRTMKILSREKIAVEYIIFWLFQGRRSRFDGLSLKGSPGMDRKYTMTAIIESTHECFGC